VSGVVGVATLLRHAWRAAGGALQSWLAMYVMKAAHDDMARHSAARDAGSRARMPQSGCDTEHARSSDTWSTPAVAAKPATGKQPAHAGRGGTRACRGYSHIGQCTL
jgi:hypothetical protein